jgi:hypothetical protein
MTSGNQIKGFNSGDPHGLLVWPLPLLFKEH